MSSVLFYLVQSLVLGVSICFYQWPDGPKHSCPLQRVALGTGPRVTPRPALVKTPGRINLCSWEDKCRVKSVKSSYTKRLQETEEVPWQALKVSEHGLMVRCQSCCLVDLLGIELGMLGSCPSLESLVRFPTWARRRSEVDLLQISGLESSLATINEEERRNRQGTIDSTDVGICAEADASDPQEGSLGKENWSEVFEPAKDHCGCSWMPMCGGH